MSLLVLLMTAGSLGLLGGLHCIAMCGALQRLAVHGTGAHLAAAAGAPGVAGLGAAKDAPGVAPGAAARAPGGPPGAEAWTPGDAADPSASRPAARVIPLALAGAGGGRAIGAGRQAGARAVPGTSALRADLAFHAARLAGYAALGAAVGGGSSLLRWGADAMPLMRPLWGTLNALLLALGLGLLVLGHQPRWIDALGQRAWALTGARLDRRRDGRPVAAGLAWALVPCGLLYSALATAALASEPLRGAAAMLAFGTGTALDLLAAQALVSALGRRSIAWAGRVEASGVRIGGALLAAMAVAALVALALGQPHPFCAS